MMGGPVRILALVTEAYGGTGGIAQYNRDFLDALTQVPGMGDIHALPRRGEAPTDTAASRLRLHPPRPARGPYAAALLRLVLRIRPQVVICGHLFMVALASFAARLCAAKLVVQVHGIEIWRTLGATRRRALSNADLVLCVSRDTRARVLAAADLPPERVIVLPNTVGDDFVPGVPRSRQDGSPQVLLSVGRLDAREAYKGHDRVIACLAALRTRGHDVVYRIAGEGEDRSRLMRLARECGVADRVQFLGFVERRALPDLYRSADLFVLASGGEGFGIVFLEAMACGTPAIGLEAGGAVDALEGLGLVVPAEGLVDAIADVLVSTAAGRTAAGERDLAERVRARFGRAVFQAGVAQAMSRLSLHGMTEACVAESGGPKRVRLPS